MTASFNANTILERSMQQLVKFVFLSFLLALALTRKCSHTLYISPHSPSSSPIRMSRQIALALCMVHR